MSSLDEFIYLIDATSYDKVNEVAVTHRWCSGPGWASKSDPTIEYESRILDAGNFETSLFQKGTSGGAADIGTGEIEINNGDHDIDDILNHAWDAAPITIRRGVQANEELTDFEVIFTGSAESLEPRWNTFSLVLRDKISDIVNKVLQQERYLGNNSLPNGVEGVAEDLKDKWKPVSFGVVEEFEAPMVNTSKYILQLNWRQVQSIQGVFVEGAALTVGNSRATLADLLSNIPSGGTFDYYLGSGSDGAYVRLAALPDGKITTSFTVGANAAARTAAAVVKDILLTYASVPSGDVLTSAFTAVDALNSAVIGYCSGIDAVKVGDAIDEISRSIQMWWAVDSVGKYKVGRLGPISGTPVGLVEKWMIARNGEGIEFVSSNDPNKGIPPYQVTVHYKKIYTVQDEADLAGIVTTDRDRVNFLKEEYRSVSSAVDGDILVAHLRSVPMEVFTLLDTESDAQDEADRLAALYGVSRFWINVLIDISVDPGFNLGDLVTVDTGRTAWTGANGKAMLVMGKTLLYRENQIQYTFWG